MLPQSSGWVATHLKKKKKLQEFMKQTVSQAGISPLVHNKLDFHYV